MSVLRFFIVPKRLGIAVSDKDVSRAYSVITWHVNRTLTHVARKQQYEKIGLFAECIDNCQLQLLRNAWFTKSKLGPKIPPTKPLSFDHSGDLEQNLPKIDPTKPRWGYQNCEELKSADEKVKRIFSVGFGTRVSRPFLPGQCLSDRNEYLKHEFLSRVQRHENDYVSQEAKIARLTHKIRTQISFCLKYRKDKLAKTHLNNNIQIRTRLLKELQKSDRPKFLQVCEALQLTYIPVPMKEDYVPKFIRPQALHKAKLEGEAIRKEKLEALEAQFAVEKEDFYAKKEVLMKQIESDLKAMGVDGQSMMNEIFDKERKHERWINSKWYKFLQRFPPVQKKYVTMKVQE